MDVHKTSNRKESSKTSPTDKDHDTLHMRREINVVSAISVIVGTIIGSGIFISPSAIAMSCGSVALSLIMWVVPAILTLLITLCYMELASVIPKAGAEYVYFKEVFGNLPGFLYAWTNGLIMLPAFYAILSLTASHYMLNYLIAECDLAESAVKITSVWLLVGIVALNSVYVQYVTRVQTFLTSFKVIALGVIIVTGIYQIIKGNVGNLQTGFEGSHLDAGSIAAAIQIGIFGYFGWQGMFSLVEEVQNPRRTIPVSFTISMTLVTLLYVLTNVAYFTVMSPAEMIASPAVAMTFAKQTLGGFAVIIPFCVALNIVGTLNASLLAGSRVYFAAARDGLFPSVCAMIHTTYLTPWPALWLMCVMAVIYIMTGNAMVLIEYQGVGLTITFVIIVLSVLYLRWTQPHLHRPMQVPLVVPILALPLSVSLLMLGVYQKPWQSLVMVVLILSGMPVYVIGVMWKNKPKPVERIVEKVWLLTQKSLMVAYTEGDDMPIY